MGRSASVDPGRRGQRSAAFAEHYYITVLREVEVRGAACHSFFLFFFFFSFFFLHSRGVCDPVRVDVQKYRSASIAGVLGPRCWQEQANSIVLHFIAGRALIRRQEFDDNAW